MRVTHQNKKILNQAIKVAQKSNSAISTGEIFKAKIIEIHTDAILLKLSDGSNLRAQVLNPERFVKGQSMDFLMSDQTKDSQLPLLEMVNVGAALNENEAFKAKLEPFGIKATEDHINAFKMIKALGLEITKENIEDLGKNVKYLDKIIKVFEAETREFLSANKTAIKGKTDAGLLSEKVLNKFALDLKVKSFDQLSKMPLKDVVIKILDKASNRGVLKNQSVDDESRAPNLQDKPPKEALKLIRAIIQDRFGRVEDEKTDGPKNNLSGLALLMKSNREFTIKNLSILSKLSYKESNLAKQIQTLAGQVDGLEVKAPLKMLLKGFDVENFKIENGVKAYFDTLVSQLKSINPEGLTEDIKENIKTILESIKFMEQDMNDVTWIQMPINLNKKQSNLDVFVKDDNKAGKKFDRNNVKLLIALNTEHLDLFQALIHIKDKVLNIDIKVENDQVKKVVDQNLHALKATLEMEPFDAINLTTHIRGKISLYDFVAEPSNLGHINIKV